MKKNTFLECINKIGDRVGLYIYALCIVALNISLAFDNVVWGDEAFSGIVVRGTNYAGLLERIYYWDSHPPLYYFILKAATDIFGSSTALLHMVSLIPFVVVILVAVFYFKKLWGWIPTAFFVTVCGLSATNVEYNLEIRMYSLAFMELLICLIFAVQIISGKRTVKPWFFMVLAGVAAAYTHYYGFIISGLLIFWTAVSYFLTNKGKSWIRGLVSILLYVVAYLPWIFVIIKQASDSANWWMTSADSLSKVVKFMTGGGNTTKIVVWLAIVLPVVTVLCEMKFVKAVKTSYGIAIKLKKPSMTNWSVDSKVIILCYATTISMLIFSYAFGIVFSPLLLVRYTYPAMPLIFTAMLVSIHWFVERINAQKDKTYEDITQDINTEEAYIRIGEGNLFYRFVLLLVYVCLAITLAAGLLDFKYFRSVTKVQDFQTERILSLIGEPTENTVLQGYGIRHLGWTVLEYYYPDIEISEKAPLEIIPNAETKNINNIWCFMGREFTESEYEGFETEGFTIEHYPEMWMGQYDCELYHVYK